MSPGRKDFGSRYEWLEHGPRVTLDEQVMEASSLQPFLEGPFEDTLLQTVDTKPIIPEELLNLVCPDESSEHYFPTRSSYTQTKTEDWSTWQPQFHEPSCYVNTQSPSFQSRSSTSERFHPKAMQSPFAYSSNQSVDSGMFQQRSAGQYTSPGQDYQSMRHHRHLGESSPEAELRHFSAPLLDDRALHQLPYMARQPLYLHPHHIDSMCNDDTAYIWDDMSLPRQDTQSGGSLQPVQSLYMSSAGMAAQSSLERAESTPAPQESYNHSPRRSRRRSKRLDRLDRREGRREGTEKREAFSHARKPVKVISNLTTFKVVSGQANFDYPNRKSYTDRIAIPSRHSIPVRTNELSKMVKSAPLEVVRVEKIT